MISAEEDFVQPVLVIVESVNTLLLAAGLILMFRGIEIGHPVYSILFCDLLATFFSSLLNAWVIPFVTSYPYYILANANSLSGLLLHCSFWCVLSILRYMYIINKTWIEETFPKMWKLFMWSLLTAVIMYLVIFSTMFGIAVYFGYPEKKILSLPFEQRVICMVVYIMFYVFLNLVSCMFYSLIVRKRGKLGVNSIDPEVVLAPNENEMQEIPSIVPSGDGLSSISASLESSIQQQLKKIEEQKKKVQHAAEIQSAITSLKTNFCMTFILLFIFSMSMVLSSEFLAIIFALFKGQAPLWTTVINFVKIQKLLQQLYDNCKEAVAAFWVKITNKCF